MATNYVSVFNEQFKEFIDFTQKTFPEDGDILSAKNSLMFIRKTNPKMIVKIWKKYIADKYKKEIEIGNIDFFINKNYNEDLMSMENSDRILETINKFREPIKLMNPVQQDKIVKYIQTLSKLTELCVV
jgi:DNA polymerase/3'-5' exonuclease PolX